MTKLLPALAITVLYTALPTANGFGLGGGNSKAARRGSAVASPVLEEALKSYPYVNDDKTKLTTNFNELARLYGDNEALEMVKVVPQVLRFNSDNFEPCLKSWEEQFGLEPSQAMIRRNPSLLAIRPGQTKDADSSMYGSYLVAALRPSPLTLAAWGVLLLFVGGNKEFWTAGGFYNGGQ
jgi:hypothetical protein